jgi:hypothetical protein
MGALDVEDSGTSGESSPHVLAVLPAVGEVIGAIVESCPTSTRFGYNAQCLSRS